MWTQEFWWTLHEGPQFKSAECERTFVRVKEEVCQPLSLLFYCARCGLVYCRAPLRGPESPSWAGGNWQPVAGICADCPPIRERDVPGSIWLRLDEDYQLALPDTVLRREVALHFKWFDSKETQGGKSEEA